VKPVLVRELIGESLREERVSQGKTLREISRKARVSLGYLSEVERGQKEASSELLAAICAALDLPLSVVLNVVSEKMAVYEGVTALPNVRAMAQAAALDSSLRLITPVRCSAVASGPAGSSEIQHPAKPHSRAANRRCAPRPPAPRSASRAGPAAPTWQVRMQPVPAGLSSR